MKKIIPILLILCATLWASDESLLPVGSEARKFLLLDLQGQRLGLKDWVGEKAPRKKPLLVLSFWSLSCVPCREELPALQRFADKYPDKVAVVLLNLDTKDQSAAVAEHVQQMKLTVPVLLDPYQVAGKNYGVCSAQGNCNVPALFGVSPEGSVVLAHSGYEGEAALEKTLLATLNGILSAAPASSASGKVGTDKNAILLEVHQSAPLDAIAKKYGMTRAQLVALLKEAEAAARTQWK